MTGTALRTQSNKPRTFGAPDTGAGTAVEMTASIVGFKLFQARLLSARPRVPQARDASEDVLDLARHGVTHNASRNDWIPAWAGAYPTPDQRRQCLVMFCRAGAGTKHTLRTPICSTITQGG
jgi:hypothetical protein